MALVEEEIHAMLFELNRIRIGLGDALDNFGGADLNFKPAGRARLGLNFSSNDDARLLRETFKCVERGGIFFLGDDALDHAGAVAKNREEQLAGFTQVVKPSANRDAASGVLAGLFDGDDGRSGGSFLGHEFVCRVQERVARERRASIFFSSLSKTVRI